jgi:4'-phosphopantetheinyl transferase
MRSQIDSSEVHLWCAFFNEIRDEALLDQYHGLLSPDERQRQSRFVFARDRHRYLVTRALVRTVLSRYADVAPAEWTFTENAYGRPEIANDRSQAREISFNLSHTSSLIVLGVAHRRALGVDTENARTRHAPVEIADRFFAPEEVATLHVLPEEHRQRRFFEYWTLKESYIKARAMGLSIPLDKFSFRFVNDRQFAISIDRDQDDSPSRWRLWQFSIAGEYLTAVCAEQTGSEVPRLVLKKVVPLGAEHDLESEDLRTSA